MPARACGTMRTPIAATMNRNTASTIRAINPASISASSLRDERRGAPDLEHLHAGSRLEHLVLIVRSRRPDLAFEPHATLVAPHTLDDGGRVAHERRRAGAQRRRLAAVTERDGPQGREQHDRHDEEGDP